MEWLNDVITIISYLGNRDGTKTILVVYLLSGHRAPLLL